MKISRYFTLREATRSQWATRNGIDNAPGPLERRNISLTARNLMDPIREHFGLPIQPSSWFRSLRLDSALKLDGINRARRKAGLPTLSLDELAWRREQTGEYWSQHLEGCAVDFEVPGVSNYEVVRWIVTESGLEFDQVILENPGPGPNDGWIHISHRPSPRREAKKMVDDVFFDLTFSGR